MHDELKIPAKSAGEAYERLLAIVRVLRAECPCERKAAAEVMCVLFNGRPRKVLRCFRIAAIERRFGLHGIRFGRRTWHLKRAHLGRTRPHAAHVAFLREAVARHLPVEEFLIHHSPFTPPDEARFRIRAGRPSDISCTTRRAASLSGSGCTRNLRSGSE